MLVLFGVTVYLFFAQHRKEEFEARLMERVNITEKMFLEKDNFSEGEFELIRSEFLQILPREVEDVVEVSRSDFDKGELQYPVEFIDEILANGKATFKDGQRQGAGRFFEVAGKDYIVIVTAVDVIGIEKMNYLKGIIITGLISCIILFVLVSVPLSHRIIRPLSYKIKMANMISANNLHQRLTQISTGDEIGELTVAFNKLLDRLESAFDAKKSFISNASHELRNPLTAIMNETDISLERDRTNEEYRESLKSISTEAERMKMLIDNLFALSKVNYSDSQLQFTYIPVVPLLEEVAEKQEYTNYKNNIKLEIPGEFYDEDIGVWGNRNLLLTAFQNIIDNACKYSNGADVVIGFRIENEKAHITIRDYGVGIPEEDLKMIGEPFFRSSNVRSLHGSGIGITLTNRIIETHNGEVMYCSHVDDGTEVRISLPIEKKLASSLKKS